MFHLFFFVICFSTNLLFNINTTPHWAAEVVAVVDYYYSSIYLKFCTFTQDLARGGFYLTYYLCGSARALVVWGCLSNKHFLFMRFKVQTFTFSIISTQQSALFTQSLIWSRKCAKTYLVMIAIYNSIDFILKIIWLLLCIFDELLNIWLKKNT